MSLKREWFGPSKEEVWHQLCEETGANLVAVGLLGNKKVEATHGEWTITLDTYTVSSQNRASNYTRFRAPYVNADNFRFSIYREGLMSTIGKKLSMLQDVIVGYDKFDEDFVIQGNNEAKLKEFFQNEYIRELLSNHYGFELTVLDNEGFFGPKYPKRTDLITYKTYGIIKDIDKLKEIFFLFSEILDQLCDIGSAYKDHPGVKAF